MRPWLMALPVIGSVAACDCEFCPRESWCEGDTLWRCDVRCSGNNLTFQGSCSKSETPHDCAKEGLAAVGIERTCIGATSGGQHVSPLRRQAGHGLHPARRNPSGQPRHLLPGVYRRGPSAVVLRHRRRWSPAHQAMRAAGDRLSSRGQRRRLRRRAEGELRPRALPALQGGLGPRVLPGHTRQRIFRQRIGLQHGSNRGPGL